LTQTASETGVAGEAQYVTTVAADTEPPGPWSYYGHTVLANGEVWRTLPLHFLVRAIGV
jgi:hypothetical protein